MPNPDTLVSIGLPVRNAGHRIADVVASVLAQDHDRIELVISDNASTDDTREVCQELAAADSRIVYHRHPENIGLFNNFVHTIGIASGEFFRWIGDDDRLEPTFASRCLEAFEADKRLILVTTGIAYTGPDGVTRSTRYEATALGSDDPLDRLEELLRLLNASYLDIDPLYGMARRHEVAAIPRRNMLQEDQVFASKLALAGPWGHVPDVLAHRNWGSDRITTMARRLDVPLWQASIANALQCRETLQWLRTVELTKQQRRRARVAVRRMYLLRQRRKFASRAGKLIRMLTPGR